jgi:hypothetical protein
MAQPALLAVPTPITPYDWAQIANRTYSDQPDFGKADGAGRACVYAQGQVVDFPGSDDTSCWEHDFEAIPLAVPGLGRVHEGIYTAWQEVAQGVMDLQGVQGLVGHSEGAAIALLAAGAMCLAGKPPLVVWAWEPPRVSCDAVLRALLAKNNVTVHVMHHGNDLVPDVPDIVLMDWQHPAPEHRFGKAAYPFPNISDHLMPGILRDAAQLAA